MKDISVVIPVYNMDECVERTLQSVIEQTVQPKEIIVVDDGSTDNSVKVVEGIGHPLIRIVRQANAGVSAARNRGAKEAKSDFVAFLDADDIWLPNHLEVTSRLIDKFPNCGVYATLYSMQEENGEETIPDFPIPFSFDGEEGLLTNYFEIVQGKYGPIHMDTLTVSKKVLESIGGFPVGMPSGEDLFTVGKLYTVSDFAYSKCVTAKWLHRKGIRISKKNNRRMPRNSFVHKKYDELLWAKPRKKGVRQYVAMVHRWGMNGAFMEHRYLLAFEKFFFSFRAYPWQKKLYTMFILGLVCAITGKNTFEIINKIKRNRN